MRFSSFAFAVGSSGLAMVFSVVLMTIRSPPGCGVGIDLTAVFMLLGCMTRLSLGAFSATMGDAITDACFARF